MLTTQNTRNAMFLCRRAFGIQQNLNTSTISDFIISINRSFENALIEIQDNLLNLSDASQLTYINEILYDISQISDVVIAENEELSRCAQDKNLSPFTVEVNEELEKEMSLREILERRIWRVRNLLYYPSKLNKNEAYTLFDDIDWFAYQYEIAAEALGNFWWQFRPHAVRRNIKLPHELRMWNTTYNVKDNYDDTVQPTTELLPPLVWKGSSVELAALFVELDAKGYIQLPSSENFETTPWDKICKAILSLFNLSARRSTSKGEPWYSFSRNFVSRKLNERNGELEYHKLHRARHKFRNIVPLNPGLDDTE